MLWADLFPHLTWDEFLRLPAEQVRRREAWTRARGMAEETKAELRNRHGG